MLSVIKAGEWVACHETDSAVSFMFGGYQKSAETILEMILCDSDRRI